MFGNDAGERRWRFRHHRPRGKGEVVDLSQMPVLQPVPIPTKNVSNFRAFGAWFTSRRWYLKESWTYKSNLTGKTYFVPAGFLFDGASVPRLLWPLIRPVGILLIPGLLHDFGYVNGYLIVLEPGETSGETVRHDVPMEREELDDLFELIGEEVNGVGLVNWLAWAGVRMGGWLPWRKHRSAHGL